MSTVVEILNKSLEKLAEVKNLYPINQGGMVLRYSKELSDYGEAKFRLRSNDPLLTTFGDIIEPHKYHIRIRRNGTIVWQGVIVDNTERTKNYIEVVAVQYLYYLDKILIRRDAETVSGDGKDNFKLFNSGTMSAAVSTILSNAVSDFGSNHPLATLTAGTVENPDYPKGFTDGTNALTGAWSFSSTIALQFDYQTAYYVLKAFGNYTNADFEITEDLVFNFKKFIGNRDNNVTFHYGQRGNIVDYNSTRLGRRMVNTLWGLAVDTDGKYLHSEQSDSTSVNTYGKLQDAIGFTDVKDDNYLRTRIANSLRFTKTPDDSPLNILLNEKGYPLGQYDIGDIVNIRIKDNVIDINDRRRVVGVTVNLHNTGRELVTVQTNKPRDEDL